MIEIEINNIKYKLKEISFDEDNVEYSEGKDRKLLIKEMISQQLEEPKLTVEEVGKLSKGIVNILIIEINKLNGLDVKYFTNSQNK